MNKILPSFAFLIVVLTLTTFTQFGNTQNQPPAAPVSEPTQACLDCHSNVSPGLVQDWLSSRHSKTTPKQALEKPKLERRVTAESFPDNFQNVTVGCYECHGQNPDLHKDNFEHFGYKINVIVSPNDCQTCHPTEFQQYTNSKKAFALDNLRKNSIFHTLVETATSVKEVKDSKIMQMNSSHFAKNETCYGCHGSEVTVKGMRTVQTDVGEIQVPVLTDWPNQGVGRINPDGSKGACTACHPRHSFSIEIARKPYTCSQCHLKPDVPAYNVYMESKHGNIFASKEKEWNWEAVPWKVGVDFRAPTCATCHNSLIVSPDGEVIAERTHDFGDRLWVRIFGLIYAHPQPKSPETYLLKNKDGLPLPATFTGEMDTEHLLSMEEQKTHQDKMRRVCQSCHSSSWVNGHLEKLDSTVVETNQMVLASTKLVQKAWDKKWADPTNPFDEAIEQKWVAQWLFYANSVRYAAAMSGPDYAAFKNGWWELTNNLQEMSDWMKIQQKKK
jgi:hypothetical protein